jgi:hypothetical protein
MNEWLEKAKRIDFDRLAMLTSERIAILRIYVQNIDKAEGGEAVHDAICRDLIFPCIGLLANFIESVSIDVGREDAK